MPDELVDEQTTDEQELTDVSTPDEGAAIESIPPQVEDQELLSTETETSVEDQELAPAPPKKWSIKGNNEVHELTEEEVQRRAEMSYGVPGLIEEKRRIQEELQNYRGDIQRFLNDPRSVVDHLNKHGFDWSQVQQHQEEPPNLYPVDEEYADDVEKQRAQSINQYVATTQREMTQMKQQLQMLTDERNANQLEHDFNTHRDKYGIPESAKEVVMKTLYSGMKQYGPSQYGIQHALQEVASGVGIGDSTNSGQLTVETIKKNPELLKQLKAELIEEYNKEMASRSEESKTPKAKTPAPPKESTPKIKGDSIREVFAKNLKTVKKEVKNLKGG